MTDLTAEPSSGTAGIATSFSAKATVVNCTLGSYEWEFGDGSPSQTVNTAETQNSISHTFSAAGTYTVRVIARNATRDAQGEKTLSYVVAASGTPTPSPTVIPATPTISDAPSATPTAFSVTPTSIESGSSGGCSFGFAPGLLSLLLPLAFLLRR